MNIPYCGWNKNSDVEEEAGNYDFMEFETNEKADIDSSKDKQNNPTNHKYNNNEKI